MLTFIFSPVLPKFDVTVNISEEVSIGQEDIEAKVCAK